MNPGTQEGAGEGMREAGRPREALRELLTAIDPAGWATDPSVTAYKLTPRLRAACANGWAAMVETAPAPQGLREAAAIRDFVARTEARARSMSGTAPGWVFLREAMKAEMSLLGAASASVSPKGEPT